MAWLWPFVAGAQQASWVIPGSATDAVGDLLSDLTPHLTYRSASVEVASVRVEACPPTGACVTFTLTHEDGCPAPAGPFCVTYAEASTPAHYKATIERVLAQGRHNDFWVRRSTRIQPREGAPAPRRATVRVPIEDPRPRPEGVPSPWAAALSFGLLLGLAAVGLADRWQEHPLRRRLLIPVLVAVVVGAVVLTGRPVVWSALLALGFFSLVFGWRCLERTRAINVLMTGLVVAGLFEVAMLVAGVSLSPERVRAYRFADDPVLDGRLSGIPNAAGVCRALSSDDLLPSLGGRSELHLASEREPASMPLVRQMRLPVLTLPGGAFVRAELSRELVKRHRPRKLVIHLSALEALRQWGAPLPCCGGRAPFRLEDGVSRFACTQGDGERTPSRLALLAARSRVPIWLEEASRVSVLAGAVDRAAAYARTRVRGGVPTPRESINAMARHYGRLADEVRRADSELVVVLEPDLVAFSSPIPHLTAARRYHDTLRLALVSRTVTVIDLWSALDAADDDRPWLLVDHGELTGRGQQVISSSLQQGRPLATPAGLGDPRR